jgi:glutathione-regulated potassium-efflux system ancillary protein KefF
MDWIAPLVMHGAAGAGDAAVEAHVAEFTRRLQAYAERPPAPSPAPLPATGA